MVASAITDSNVSLHLVTHGCTGAAY